MAGSPFQGRVQVYTGDGKGKTTAALGLALRAAGRNLATYIGQFMKGPATGELEAPRLTGALVTIEPYGAGRFPARKGAPDPEDIERARAGLEKARAAMRSGRYRIVVLDEACTALRFGLLAEEEVLALVRERPADVELVLTGRGASEALVQAADLVTEMREVKHYHAQGLPARDGIER